MAKVMLVEDDNNLREIYGARLQAEGYEIVSAKDGEEALVVAKAEKPELIVSDVMMPKISGFEMLDILRNTDGLKDVKVIMLTALGQSEDQERADKLGADRYLVKSQVTLEDIVKTAHELLNDQAAAATPANDDAQTATPAPTEEPAEPEASAPIEVATPPAPEPQPEPPATTEPAPVPEPVSQTPPSDDSNIENFVVGASEEPTAAPAPAANPVPAPAPDPAASSDAATDDKLMNNAVQTLVNSVPNEDKPSGEADPNAPGAMPDVKVPVTEPAPAEGPGKAAETPNPSMAHTKVIEPVENEPQKDINNLLANEEAAGTAAQPGNVVQPNSPEEQAGDDPVDPHSIAL